MYARSNLPPTPARLPRFRSLIDLCSWPMDTMNSDETLLDESNFGRLNLDDPAVRRQPSEEALSQPEMFSISPTWSSNLWMLDGSNEILEPKAPCSAGGDSGLQDPIGSTTDSRGINESWTAPLPVEARFNVSTSITQRDANLRVPSPGASLHAEQHQHMNLGTHLRDNCIK